MDCLPWKCEINVWKEKRRCGIGLMARSVNGGFNQRNWFWENIQWDVFFLEGHGGGS